MELDRIVEKIRKCLALSESSNENEAKLAAEKAAEMMTKYRIDMAALHDDPSAYEVKVVEHPLFKGKGLWHTRVALHVAYATDCGCFKRNGKTITLVGTAESLELADYLYNYLVAMLRHLSRVYCKEFYGVSNPGATVRYAFLEGAAESVGERLREKHDATKRAAAVTHCTALMVLDKEALAVKDYMTSLGLRPGTKRQQHGGAAYAHGYEAGRQVQLRDAIKQGSSGSKPKLLGR